MPKGNYCKHMSDWTVVVVVKKVLPAYRKHVDIKQKENQIYIGI